MTLSRRELFGLLRRGGGNDRPGGGEAPVARRGEAPVARRGEAVEVAPPAVSASAASAAPSSTVFSLDAFYAGRTADRSLPPFAIHATAAAATSRVGAGPSLPAPQRAAAPLADAAAAAARSTASPIAPELVPEVLPHRCLATSSFCSVCSEHCPAPGAIVTRHGQPRVVAELCDGCGRCIAACPAPILAFALVPRPPKVPA